MNQLVLEKLEFTQIIETLKTFAISELGRLRIGEIQPTNDFDKINNQLKEVEEAQKVLAKSQAIPLGNLSGIVSIKDKLVEEKMLNVQEIAGLVKMLKTVGKMMRYMASFSYEAPQISSYVGSMFELKDLVNEIELAISGEEVRDEASPQLERIRKRGSILQSRIESKLNELTQSAKMRVYLQETMVFKRNDKYTLAVKKEYKHMVDGQIIDVSASGSTLFIEPRSIMNLKSELEVLKAEEENELFQILSYLSSFIHLHTKEILINLEGMIYYDVLFAKGKYARSIDGKRVNINLDRYTHIISGVHPLLGKSAVPLDIELGKDYQSLIITGPNTGGKTVALKTLGLLTMMVQAGLHIPASRDTQIGIYSDILIDIGDGQNIAQSLSTFSSHVKNIINILAVANPYSLVILDEVGAGTDPKEGEGLAIAILENLHNRGVHVVATSHYSGVKTYALNTTGVINGRMTFDVNTLKPLYQLLIGEAGESNALLIAKQLGLNQEVIDSAFKWTYGTEIDVKKELDKSEMKARLSQHTEGEVSNVEGYKKVSKPKGPYVKPESTKVFNIGDAVYIHYLKKRGLVYATENEKGEYGVQVKKEKLLIHKKRLSLFIDSKEMYPEGYDFDIVFKSVEYRKTNHLMGRRHVDGLELKHED